MSGELITIEGLEETEQMLTAAPRTVVANAFLKALQAGGNVIRDEVELRIPYDGAAAGNPAHGGKGALRQNLRTVLELDSAFRGGSVDIGYGPLGHIGLWLEYGHREIGHKPGSKALGQDVPAHPILRPAVDAAAERAIEAVAESLDASFRAGIPGLSTSAE